MKDFKILALPLAILLFVASCTKEGPAGPAGTNGTNGTNGNANVVVINHPTDSIGNSKNITINLPASVSTGTVDSGLILVYYKGLIADGCDYWYQAPGLGCGASFQTRWIYDAPTKQLILSIKNPDGSTYTGSNRTFARTKVIIAPGSTFLTGKKDIDFSNYEEVKRYLNLND